jgi:hypothetical protein
MDREKNSPVNIPIMYLVKTPQIIQQLFPNFIWKIPTDEKVLYLTFDDGPIPEVTPWVAEQLEAYQARGTFFCVGDNVRKHPDVFDRLLEGGHEVGNHTFNHLNGWGADNIPISTMFAVVLMRCNLSYLDPPTVGLVRDKPNSYSGIIRL